MAFAFKGLKGFAADAATALNRAVQVSTIEGMLTSSSWSMAPENTKQT